MMKTRLPFFCVIFFLILLTTKAGADIDSVVAEISAIDSQIQTLTNEDLLPLEAEIGELRQGMDEAREFMNVFAVRNQWLLEKYRTHHRNLKQYQGREMQLSMTYADFFEAKKTWEESSEPAVRREQIIVMFRYLYGNSREPGQLELNPNTQQDFVDMADLIVRRNAVARIGQALVLLGDLTTELIGFITGIPANLKEAAFTTIEFTAKMTSRLLPSETVASLNKTCLQYIPFLELQKSRTEQLANDLNDIRDRDEFGGEGGRVEALAKTRALIEFEQEILAELESEINEFRARQAEVAANFARVQGELNQKIQERDALRTTLRTFRQNKIDKEFELKQLQEQQVLSENGGSVNYVTNLTASSSSTFIASDALTSALLGWPRYDVLSSRASYISAQSHTCEYYEDEYTRYETYHTKKTFSAPAVVPEWRRFDSTGDLNIVDDRAFGVSAGVVPLRAVLSPTFVSEKYVLSENVCPDDYRPTGSGETTSGLVNIHVHQINEALFLPDFYYYHERDINNLAGTDLFAAIKDAAETYGPGIDLFVDGTLQQWGGSSVYATVRRPDGTTDFYNRNDPEIRPGGDQELFELNNRMKVLGKGEVTLTPLVFDSDGVQVPEGSLNAIHVTGNTVEAFVDAHESTGLTPADDVLVVIDEDEPAAFAVSVDGPADMSHYEVKWRYYIYQETSWPKGWIEFDRHNGAAVTFFSSDSDKWISANPVTLNTPADYNQQIKVEFDVCRKYDGEVVYSDVFDHVRTIVKGKNFFLAVRDSDETYLGGNYFLFRDQSYLAPQITSRNLELRLDTGDGESVPVPFTDQIQGLLYGTDSADSQDLGVIKVYEEYIYTSLSTIDASGRVELGFYEIQEPDADNLLNDLGIIVERTGSKALTGFDVNLFRVHFRETTRGPMYVLKGCAPTSLENFKTKWTFFDQSTERTSFVRIGGTMQESLTPMIKGLKRVEIINPLGESVGSMGFLSASGQTSVNKVSGEITRYYSVTSEYRYNPAEDRYAEQLTQIAKKARTGSSDQLTLDFQFPAGFPRVLVRTVNDMNDASLPVIENVMIDGQGLAFDAALPESGFFTILTVLHAPASGSLNIDGTHVAYTLKNGFNGKDRFVIRLDCNVCNITPDAVYHNLEVEIDASARPPIVGFKQVFTPFDFYGSHNIGFALMDASGQPLSTSLVREPDAADQLIVEASEDGAAIKIDGFPANAQDSFGLEVTLPGGGSGVADISVGYYTGYPEFTAYRNRDRVIPSGLILHRFFEFFDNGARYIKNIWASPASGKLYLNGIFPGYENQITADDLQNLVFRPNPDYTGPASIYLYGSADGETWIGQRIGGMILADDMDTYLAEPLWILRLLSGKKIYPLEHSEIGYIRDESRIDMAEGMFLLQKAAGRR